MSEFLSALLLRLCQLDNRFDTTLAFRREACLAFASKSRLSPDRGSSSLAKISLASRRIEATLTSNGTPVGECRFRIGSMRMINALLSIGIILATLMVAALAFGYPNFALYVYLFGLLINWAGSSWLQGKLARGVPTHKFDADLMATLKVSTFSQKISNLLVTFSLAVFWHTQFIVYGFMGFIQSVFDGDNEAIATSGREKSPTDILVIMNFMLPLNILVLAQGIIAILFLVWLWPTLALIDSFYLIPPLYAIGVVLVLASYLMQSNLVSNFSSSFLKPFFYFLIAMALVFLIVALSRLTLEAWDSGATQVAIGVDAAFKALQNIAQNGYFGGKELLLSASSMGDLAGAFWSKISSFSFLDIFDLAALTLGLSAFSKNAISAIRYKRTDIDKYNRALAFIRLKRMDWAQKEWKTLETPEKFPELHSQVMLLSRNISSVIALCAKTYLGSNALGEYNYSQEAKLYILFSAFFTQNRTTLTQAYAMISLLYKETGNFDLAVALWRMYSATHQLPLGQIISLYPSDVVLVKLKGLFSRLDETLDSPKAIRNIISEELGDVKASMYLTIGMQIINAMADCKNDRILLVFQELTNELISKFSESVGSFEEIRGIEVLEWGSVATIAHSSLLSESYDFFDMEKINETTSKLKKAMIESGIVFPTLGQP